MSLANGIRSYLPVYVVLCDLKETKQNDTKPKCGGQNINDQKCINFNRDAVSDEKLHFRNSLKVDLASFTVTLY